MSKPIQFKSTPDHIRALRKALNWTQRDLANYLGTYLCEKARHSITISSWERGLHKPRMVYRRKMAQLAHYYREEWLSALRD